MCYICQGEGTYFCGAYALAYWLWDKEIDNPCAELNDKEAVENRIYPQLVFTEANLEKMKDIEESFGENYVRRYLEYSNPIKLMKLIKGKEPHCEFYRGNDRIIQLLCNDLATEELQPMDGNFNNKLEEENCCGIEIVRSGPVLHYLYRPNHLQVIDPADGVTREYENHCGEIEYTKTNAGIIIR